MVKYSPMRPVALIPLTILLGWSVLAGGAFPVQEEAGGSPQGMVPGYADDETVGIEEKLGETIPLDLVFVDEEGEPVVLGDLFTLPTVLTMVYFNCPSICSPLMHELASVVDELDLVPGVDYNLVTVSFDIGEDHELARSAKKNLLGAMERKIPPESWRFLTGDAANISRLTDATGFRFKREGEEFIHAGTIVYLSNEGKIVRYLPGLEILPANMKLAIIDAAEGRARSFIQRIQRLCYAYDDDGRGYVFQINRVILAGTLLFVGVFLAAILIRRKGQPKEARAN